ncbi:MAG: hypothetical protein P8Y67_11510 [Alphaproteobacteria bacterium]
MTKPYLKGVSDIPSRMNRPRNKSDRSQNATTLARLEQQKALLEKQLQVWLKQKAVTEERLRNVNSQIRTVQQALKLPRPASVSASRKSIASGKEQTKQTRAQAVEFTF